MCGCWVRVHVAVRAVPMAVAGWMRERMGGGGGVDLGLDASSGMGGRDGSDSCNHEVVGDPMALHLQQPQVLQDDPTAWAPPQLRRGQQRLGFNKHAIVTGYS